MSILKIHSLVTLGAIFTLGLATLSGCEIEDQDGLDSGLDTAVEAELADEADLADDNDEQAAALVPVYCSLVTYGDPASVDDKNGGTGSGTITISGTKRKDATGDMTVKVTMSGNDTSIIKALSISGAIWIDGVQMGSANCTPSAVGKVAYNSNAVSQSVTCKKSITYTEDAEHTVEVKDSKTTNARWEFNRSTGNSQVYDELSATGQVVCSY